MTFVTRYTPAPGEQALLKHVDGAGKVDGSLVVALPGSFVGGGLTFWDGKSSSSSSKLQETHYDTRSGDVALIDRCVNYMLLCCVPTHVLAPRVVRWCV